MVPFFSNCVQQVKMVASILRSQSSFRGGLEFSWEMSAHILIAFAFLCLCPNLR